ncbi:hypothetical protein [Mucilaginibacter sp.]|uniref:hypothetical protein n=1 Tax=Mucilaginibacter sp. TaxID=1882438 RepID=UPI003D11FD78
MNDTTVVDAILKSVLPLIELTDEDNSQSAKKFSYLIDATFPRVEEKVINSELMTKAISDIESMKKKIDSIYTYVETVQSMNIKVKTSPSGKANISQEEKSILRKKIWVQPKKKF